MNPGDPNEPLPTTPATGESAGQPPAEPSGPTQWGAPPPPPPSWGAAPPAPPPAGWGAAAGGSPPAMPPPAPPRRDRLALGIVAFVFGGLFLVFFGFLILAYGAMRGDTARLGGGPRVGVVEITGAIGTGAGGVDGATVLKQIRRCEEDTSLK